MQLKSMFSLLALPGIPNCKLTEDDLKSLPYRILTISNGQFYPGEVTKIIAPGIYEVLIYKERCRKPEILCSEEVLSEAVRILIWSDLVIFLLQRYPLKIKCPSLSGSRGALPRELIPPLWDKGVCLLVPAILMLLPREGGVRFLYWASAYRLWWRGQWDYWEIKYSFPSPGLSYCGLVIF